MTNSQPSATRRRIGRVTILERFDALIVSAPFLSRTRALVLVAALVVAFGVLGVLAYGGAAPRRGLDPLGTAVVLGICGYVALVLALNRTVTTVRRDRVVVRRGPVPMWPATTIDAARIEDVYAAVVRGIAGRGGRMELDAVMATLAGGRTTTLVDDAGDAHDAQAVAATITTWLWSHVP